MVRFFFRSVWMVLIGLALLLSIYLPVNNVFEYRPLDAESMSWHFVMFTFFGSCFFVLFGKSLWAKSSPRARWLGSLAIVGWMVDLFIISNSMYLQNTLEPYVIGSMIMVAPCLVHLLDRCANAINVNLARRKLRL